MNASAARERFARSVLTAALFACCMLARATGVAAEEPVRMQSKANKSKASDGAAWLASLEEAQSTARKTNRPLLVKFDASFCIWCKKLDEELAKPELAAPLARFVLVKLDVGHEADAAARLHIDGTPALRVLTPLGRVSASQDGFREAATLVKWLGDQYSVAMESPEADLASTSVPGVLEVVRIVRVLKHRDPALREAALARLRPFPREASPAIASALRDGNLQSRLAALELLRHWQAPAADLDPWDPATLSQAKLASVDAWVRKTQEADVPAKYEPSADELAAADREIDAMLKLSAAEAAVARERLAKFSTHLLPTVIARLKETEDAADRERLAALRYRLVATTSRMLDWPGGIERLASRDIEERRRAVDELVRRAQPYDQGLLLELFGDSDALVRELALGGLQAAAGSAADATLVKLLEDPEPNVRAAILKQWAEKPDASLLPHLKKYVASETDADLLVHAIRVLRGMEAGVSPTLIGLLKHDAWQVRAEAAEALTETTTNGRSAHGVSDAEKVDAYEALLELLDDEDGYVVSRAVEGLRGSNLPAAAKPLFDLARRRADLAPAVIGILVESDDYRRAATKLFRELTVHAEPAVRAAAVKALATDIGVDCTKEILAGLADADRAVRIVAAEAVWNRTRQTADGEQASAPAVVAPRPGVFEAIAQAMFGGGAAPQGDAKPAERKDATKQTDDSASKAAVKEPPEVPLLRKMTASSDLPESTTAAKALVGLGFANEAFEHLRRAVAGDAALIEDVAEVLPVLDWESREKLFAVFTDIDPNVAARAANMFAQRRDERAADVLWKLLSNARLSSESATGLITALQQAYLGVAYYNVEQASAGDLKRLKSEALAKLQSGGERERFAALALAAVGDPAETIAAAERILSDEDRGSPDLRELAFRLLLLIETKSDAERRAIDALQGSDARFLPPALALLVGDDAQISEWEGHGYFLSQLRNRIGGGLSDSRASSSNPFDPAPPRGLKAADLKQVAASAASPVAEYVHYFQILLDETEDIASLANAWKAEPENTTFRRLLVRAVAYLNDPVHVPLLEQVYVYLKANRRYELGDFYWTIRIMSGPEILELRKRVRDETGIQNLH